MVIVSFVALLPARGAQVDCVPAHPVEQPAKGRGMGWWFLRQQQGCWGHTDRSAHRQCCHERLEGLWRGVETTLSRRRAHSVPLTARPQLSTVKPTATQGYLLHELARSHLQIESVGGLEAQSAKPLRTSVRFRHHAHPVVQPAKGRGMAGCWWSLRQQQGCWGHTGCWWSLRQQQGCWGHTDRSAHRQYCHERPEGLWRGVETTLSRRRAHGVPLTARPQLSTVEPTAKQDFLLQSELARGHLQIESVDGLEAQRAKPQRTSVRFRHLGRGRLGMCVAQSALPVSSSLPAVHPVIACEGREVVLLLPLGRVLWLLWGRRMRQQWCGAGRVRRASRDRKYLCFKFVWRLALQIESL